MTLRCEDDFPTGCQNVSLQKQQFFSGLHLPGGRLAPIKVDLLLQAQLVVKMWKFRIVLSVCRI